MFNQLYLDMFDQSFSHNGFNFVFCSIDVDTPFLNCTCNLWSCRVFPIVGEPIMFYFRKKSDCLRFSNKFSNHHSYVFWNNVYNSNSKYSLDYCSNYCLSNKFDPLS